MPRSSSINRRTRSKTFSGLSAETLTTIKQESVPPILEDGKSGGDSSPGEISSPETPNEPDLKHDQKENKSQRKKKNRRPKIVMSPAVDMTSPMFFEDDIKHRDGGFNKKFSFDDYRTGGGLGAPKLEKSSSFRRRSKPAYLEGMVAREETKSPVGRPDSKSNGRKDEYNIVLLGDFGVGKTAFAVRFVTRRYLHEYDPILERTYEKHIHCSTGPQKIKLWDTVNKSYEKYTEQADGFIVMYSTTSSQSAHNAQNTIHMIRSSKYAAVRAVPMMLLGTKCELEQARKVRAEDQEKFAKHHGCSWKETSVACTINIDTIIKTLIEEIILTDNGRFDNNNGHAKLTSTTSLSRKPSAAKKHIMKGLLSSKKKEKS